MMTKIHIYKFNIHLLILDCSVITVSRLWRHQYDPRMTPYCAIDGGTELRGDAEDKPGTSFAPNLYFVEFYFVYDCYS